jgi:hypothetical protein
MKKTILAIFASAALAFSCNDGNRTSERDDDNDGIESEETLEPSTEESDTTSTWDQDRDRDHDENELRDRDDRDDSDLDNDETDTRRDTVSTRDDGTRDDQR